VKVSNRLTDAQREILAAVVAGERTVGRLCRALHKRPAPVQHTLDALVRRNLLEPVAAHPEPVAYVPRKRAEKVLAEQARG
jgi:hypothetical protein